MSIIIGQRGTAEKGCGRTYVTRRFDEQFRIDAYKRLGSPLSWMKYRLWLSFEVPILYGGKL